ncbi:GNAT family N-acetyltransferase [Luteimonas salinilitoris]|uniref:GNAT family N-acetyltransferase n=1 Tax=Luteimonas salinilitoris TaxID=3237697 RepID=A0ABV4HSR3_9GAMM
MSQMGRIIFSTKRLIGRHLLTSDVPALLDVYGDADAMRWVGDGQPLTQEDCKRWVEVSARNYRSRGYGMSAIVAHESNVVVGFCGLVHPDNQPEAELKYAFGRSSWGRGYATEAARAMLAYAHGPVGLCRVIATVYPENLPSQRVLLKAGLKHTSSLPTEDGKVVLCFLSEAGERSCARLRR